MPVCVSYHMRLRDDKERPTEPLTLGPVVAGSSKSCDCRQIMHHMLAECSVLSVQRRSCRDGRADQKARLGRSPWFLVRERELEQCSPPSMTPQLPPSTHTRAWLEIHQDRTRNVASPCRLVEVHLGCPPDHNITSDGRYQAQVPQMREP